MTIACCVLGLGYIGLPTAAVLASAGHHVFGVDVNVEVVETVNNGQIHIEEPDLQHAVADAVSSGSLIAQLNPVPADAFLIAVPTPLRSGDAGIPTNTRQKAIIQKKERYHGSIKYCKASASRTKLNNSFKDKWKGSSIQKNP